MDPVGRAMVSTRGGPDPAFERLGVAASSVKAPTFACSLSKRGRRGGCPCIMRRFAGTAIVGRGARHGTYGLLGAAALLVGPVLWVVAHRDWRTAWRVVVSDQYIEATGGSRNAHPPRMGWRRRGPALRENHHTASDPSAAPLVYRPSTRRYLRRSLAWV